MLLQNRWTTMFFHLRFGLMMAIRAAFNFAFIPSGFFIDNIDWHYTCNLLEPAAGLSSHD